MEALQSKYEKKAEAFKDEQAKRSQLSSFASYELRDKRKKREDLVRKSESAYRNENLPENMGFIARMSIGIGLSRYRLSRLQLPSDE
jgi:hypothetical protein